MNRRSKELSKDWCVTAIELSKKKKIQETAVNRSSRGTVSGTHSHFGGKEKRQCMLPLMRAGKRACLCSWKRRRRGVMRLNCIRWHTTPKKLLALLILLCQKTHYSYDSGITQITYVTDIILVTRCSIFHVTEKTGITHITVYDDTLIIWLALLRLLMWLILYKVTTLLKFSRY